MKKYSESVLEYKNSFKSISELVDNTDKIFEDKYFTGGFSNKIFSLPFIPGQIYSFQYKTDSKISKNRPFINRNPVIICTDVFTDKKDGSILKGIDLITVPPKYRIEIISKIFDSFYTTLSKNEEAYEKSGKITPIQLRDDFLDRALRGSGYKNSMFGFKIRFIEDVKILDLDDWYKLPYLKFSEIEGLQTQGIYKEYESKLI